MKERIPLKVKVAHSSACGFLFILICFGSFAQAPVVTKISYACQSTSLEKVLEHLSSKTGAYFIYSSSKIQTSTPVTLSVKNYSLEETLLVLGRKLNLHFKMEGRHVIIRTIERSVPTAQTTLFASTSKTDIVPRSPASVSAPPNVGYHFSSPVITVGEVPSTKEFSRQATRLQPYFNASLLRRVPMQYLKRINTNPSRGWFISAGINVSDYSAGMQMQVGIPKLYLEYSPTWLRSGEFMNSYGVGTSFRLSNHMSLNPVYSFSALNRTTTSVMAFNTHDLWNIKQSMEHHQLRLNLQYALSKKWSARFGVTFNQLNSVYRFSKQKEQIHITRLGGDWDNGGSPSLSYDPDAYHTLNVKPALPDLKTSSFWIGWEASFSYKINFSRKP